jgi:hypothetical protein
VDTLTWFGVFAVSAMMICYALEAIWALVALKRWRSRVRPA